MLLTQETSGFINFLRAISSQTVMIMHALILNNLVTSSSPVGALHCFAVMVFFVISGFVVSNSIQNKKKEYGFKNYLIDRFCRIYSALIPAFVFFTLLFLFVYWLTNQKPFEFNIAHLLSNILMLQENLLYKEVFYHLPVEYNFVGLFANNIPLWSLSIEWWFYIFWGLIVFKKINNYTLTNYILLFISLCYIVGYIVLPSRVTYGLTFIWFAGVLVQFLVARYEKPTISLVLIFTILFFTILSYIYFYSLAIIFFALLFMLVVFRLQHKSSKVMSLFFNLFKWPSNYSFSIYILHYPILLAALIFIKNPVYNFLFVFIISNVISYFFYLLFESKHKILSNKLKNFFK